MSRVASRTLLAGMLALGVGALLYVGWSQLRPGDRVTRLQLAPPTPVDTQSEDEQDTSAQSRSRRNRVQVEARSRRAEGHN